MDGKPISSYFESKKNARGNLLGLDSVELVLAVEDAFGIEVTDEEAGNVYTVGDLHNLVVSKLSGQAARTCLTSAAFYRTRRGIIDVLSIDRRQIRPSTSLSTVIPRSHRRAHWHSIQNVLKMKLPELRHPRWTVQVLLALGLVTAVTPGIYMRAGLPAIGLLSLVGWMAGLFLVALTPALAVNFPSSEATVGDLARDVLALNQARVSGELRGIKKSEIWESLSRLIVLQTGVAREKITPEARIADDLGID
jgi:acyl carrier protein